MVLEREPIIKEFRQNLMVFFYKFAKKIPRLSSSRQLQIEKETEELFKELISKTLNGTEEILLKNALESLKEKNSTFIDFKVFSSTSFDQFIENAWEIVAGKIISLTLKELKIFSNAKIFLNF